MALPPGFSLQEYLAGVVTWNAHLVFEHAVDPLVKRCFQEEFPDHKYEQEKRHGKRRTRSVLTTAKTSGCRYWQQLPAATSGRLT